MNRVAILALALVLAVPAAVQAHALGAEAKLKDGRVTVEAFYDDDTPAVGAKVVITGADGKTAAEGKTDKDGRWTFPAPATGKYQILVDAGAGHRKSLALTIPGAAKPPPNTKPDEPLAPPAPSETVIVSEGPTRSEFTGPMRLVRLTIGLVIIAGTTWAVIRVMRIVKRPPAPDVRPAAQPQPPDPVSSQP